MERDLEPPLLTHLMLKASNIAVAPPGRSDPVLEGVSLSIAGGEWVAIVGANGCGKTSLVLSLAGLWPVRAGTLERDGAPFGPDAVAARRDVAVILQEPASQLLQATVRDELTLTARNLGVPEAEVEAQAARWSDALSLSALMDRDPLSLSAGEQQRVLIAASLVARPRLLIADEPGAHLDATSRREVLERIRAEVFRGLTVVWVTQEPEECAAADRVLDLEPVKSPVATVSPGREPAGRSDPAPFGISGSRVSGPASRSHDEPEFRIHVAPLREIGGPCVATLDPLEILVERSGTAALVGPNGSGKSVIMACVAGILSAPQVRVERCGSEGPPPILAAQHPEEQLFEERVVDELLYAAVQRGASRERTIATASAWLDGLGFDPRHFLDLRVWDLSAGEKRVVQVLATLLAPASLALLDEPTCGLDPFRRENLARLVREEAGVRPILTASQDETWVAAIGAVAWTVGSRKSKSQRKNGLTEACP